MYFIIWHCRQDGEALVKKVKGVYCFKVKSKDKEGVWIVDLKNGSGSVKFNPQGMSVFLL